MTDQGHREEEQRDGNILIKIRKGEPVEKGLRRMKKKLEREEIITDVRNKRYFMPPSRKKYLKKKEQAFRDMLRRRHNDA